MGEPLVRTDPVPTTSASHAGVTITLAPLAARFSLRTRDPVGLPAKVLTTGSVDGGTALCLGPDEWLLILAEGAVPAARDGVHSITDIGHRNVAFVVEGPQAAALLQCGCALDLAMVAFPPGKATRTLYEGVDIVLWRTEERRFHVQVWRSFAPYLWAALNLAAGDLGPA